MWVRIPPWAHFSKSQGFLGEISWRFRSGKRKFFNQNNMKYFIYARKSTEDDDHQVLSIESQLAELREFAAKEKPQ